MADQLKEIADIPQEFLKDGMQFINRCTKPDKREFIKISQGASFALLC
jgi:protein transport protein SEC61 subunit gamma-like protein